MDHNSDFVSSDDLIQSPLPKSGNRLVEDHLQRAMFVMIVKTVRRTRSHRIKPAQFASVVFAPMLLAASPDDGSGMLAQRLAEPPLWEIQSAKDIVDLEYCVANAITATTGIPQGAYHDGKDRLIIFGNRISEVKVFLAVTLERNAGGTKISVRGRNEKALVGFRPALEQCL